MYNSDTFFIIGGFENVLYFKSPFQDLPLRMQTRDGLLGIYPCLASSLPAIPGKAHIDHCSGWSPVFAALSGPKFPTIMTSLGPAFAGPESVPSKPD